MISRWKNRLNRREFVLQVVANLAEEEGGEDDGEEGLGCLDGVGEGDGDLAQAHVGEHRAQHVPQGQRRDLAQLQPQKLQTC
jgi:hypothetical protein